MDQVLEYAIKQGGGLSWVAFFGLLMWVLRKNETREKAMQATIDAAQAIISQMSEKMGIRLERLEKGQENLEDDMSEIKNYLFKGSD